MTSAERARLLRLYRAGRFATLARYLAGHAPAERRAACKAYFAQAWRGSVKGSIRHLERVTFVRYGEERGLSKLLQGFRSDLR